MNPAFRDRDVNTYDADGKLTIVQPPLGNKVAMAYDKENWHVVPPRWLDLHLLR